MSLFALMTQLPKRDRERIARCVRDFAQAWEYCTIEQLPQLTELHLPRNAPALRTLVLQEFILVDLKNRWTKGEPAVLEYYLEVFQELGGADGICTQLIYEEYRIRSNYDRGIALREYQRRFPHHYSELLRVAAETIDPASTEAGTLTPSAPLEMVMVGGGFRLIRLLGRGTYGEVWLAEAPGGVQVALKLSRALGYQVTRGELRSLEAIKRLRHPFLIQLQAYWQRDDQIIIAMELGGINLEERLRECQQEGHPGIPAAELVGYVRDCAEALDYLHREGTVHRDIKPANILIQN
ncbi:MAG: serine/threonine protein kinase, partial [Pirellulaceae bacterium]